ncbi:MAG TPA: sugar phosphate isomerase/epimerase [Kiritimatiellia bacterium]|nr:sugar phosphate isomerase/epimerase [Kiritimatiellia bacterium]
MKLEQVALQLYTVRDFLKTPADIAATLRKTAAIGYRAVQVSGVPDGVISPAEIRALCAESNLVLCATHEPGARILGDPAAVVERLRALDCAYTAYPYPAGIDFDSEESVAGLIRGLNESGRVLAEAGMTLTYHNHNHEFRKRDGRTLLDRIYAETEPGYVQGEIDTYWVQYGGGDPVAWCRKLAGRLPLLHMKDYMTTADNKPAFAEIGEGLLDFPAIIEAAESSGCQWFIVEQDVCPGDPFDSAARSLDYIGKHLLA